jgi:hypothetical protein
MNGASQECQLTAIKPAERWLLLIACLAVGWFYVWTLRSTGESWDFGREHRDYYNLLIDGYLSGQLNMKVEVPEALLNLKDPYDPGTRPPGLGLHDASFYQGKYYIYFGAAPMVVLMLPFRVLTGMDLPLPVAVLMFTYGGFFASVGVWLAIRRRYFPETSAVVGLAGVLVLGLAGLGSVLLRRPDMWELPIAGGYCFAMLALLCVWHSLHAEAKRGRWLAGASLCAGLAIASRPTYLIASPFLVAPHVWWWWQERRLPWAMAMRVVAPLAVVGAAMAWHNYARFDDPLQFGQKYQFSLDYESKLPHFRAAYVPFTANAHFFSAARWSRYYPFIHRAELGEAPEGFTIHRGDVYGLLTNFPIAWLVLLAPLALWRRPPEDRGRIGAWLASAALLFALPAGLMLFFFSALARYQMDFSPAFLLLACVGLLGLERWLTLAVAATWRGLARLIWVPAALYSVGFGMLFSVGFERLLKEHNPALDQAVARQLNRVPAFFESIAGVRHGPLELTLRLPSAPGAREETLLTVGEQGESDRFFVRYVDQQRVLFGIRRHDRPELLSRLLSLDANAVHRVSLTVGSLFPPATHPYFARETSGGVRRIQQLVGLAVEGEPVLLEQQRTSSAIGSRVRLGAEALAAAAYPRFSGTVVAARRLDDTTLWPVPRGNFVRLRLAFKPAAAGKREPLVAFGTGESSALLTVNWVAPDRVTFGISGPGDHSRTSEGTMSVSARTCEVIVRAEPAHDAIPARIFVWLDGALVWAPAAGDGINFPTSVIVGRNVIGARDCAAEFGGQIFSVQQDARGRDPLTGAGDTLRMSVKFPSNRMGGREPIVVTGCTGAGDLLIVDYLDGQTVQFALDHWGSPTRTSKPIPIDFAQVHALEITMASLQTVADVRADESVRAGSLRVKLDGVVVWEEVMDLHAAETEEIAIGRNTIGGTRCGPVFGGEIRSVERVMRE